MLAALGVKVTAEVLSNLARYTGKVGKVLYTGAIAEASAETVLALKAQAASEKLLVSFSASPDVLASFSAWQALETGTSAAERASMEAAEAAARALEAEHGLPAGSIKLPSAAKAGKTSIAAAEEARAAYIALVVGQWKQHLRLGIKASAVAEYATSHYSATANMETAGISAASIALPNTRKASVGNGTRRGFLQPEVVAGIPFAGTWQAAASQLLAAEVVETGSNFVNNPALGRAARALKDKRFEFAHGTYTGEYILAHLEEFKVAASEESASAG